MDAIWSQVYVGLYAKYSLFLSVCNETWIFCTDLKKNTQVSNFMQIRSVGEKLLHEDGPTDTAKVTDAFRKSANAPKNFTP